MTRHVGPPAGPSAPPVPEPTYAERARTLVEQGRTGMLATLSRRRAGHPFGSVMPYALDDAGQPLVLISSLAMHTQNLLGDARASLLVMEPADDVLAAGRLTLMGDAVRLASAERAAARAAYLARHPGAASWVDFDDFAFWRLTVLDVYFVGGFGAMDWLAVSEYAAARPDPLAEAAPDILAHMNRDHADALVTFARVLAGEPAEEARMAGVDRLGFRLRLRAGGRLSSCRIAFPREVTSADQCREVLIEMLADCRRRG